MLRQSRKLAHLRHAQSLSDGPDHTGLQEVQLLHNCLPGFGLGDVSLQTAVAGVVLPHPVMINAITGGAPDVAQTNRDLAKLAKAAQCAMAVGSQYASLENKSVRNTFALVREEHPDGIFLANLGAHVTGDEAQEAVDMLGAQALQIHLNVGQELVMAEGDRDFSGYLERIAAVVRRLRVPVIVKETGCGMAAEQVRQLAAVGVAAIDVGGAGGTNFLAIEAARSGQALSPELLAWGVPTATSLVEAKTVLPAGVSLIASGGLRTAADMVKALALGAHAVAVAGPVLRQLAVSGDQAVRWLHELRQEMQLFMVLCGAKTIPALHEAPLVITGRTAEWLRARGLYPDSRSAFRQGRSYPDQQ